MVFAAEEAARSQYVQVKDTRPNSTQRGYNSKWQRSRLIFLQDNPLCTYCQQSGYTAAATVVDHIKPHKGNDKLFWSRSNWQALCKPCHDSLKQRIEHGQKQTGLDGWPIEDNA